MTKAAGEDGKVFSVASRFYFHQLVWDEDKDADTSVLIENHSKMKGVCRLDFSGAEAPVGIFTPPIGPGGAYTFTVSEKVRKFNGSMIANCSFPQAAGIAVIFCVGDNPDPKRNRDKTYEAVIIQDPGVAVASAKLNF